MSHVRELCNSKRDGKYEKLPGVRGHEHGGHYTGQTAIIIMSFILIILTRGHL